MQIEKYTDRLKTFVQSAQDLALRSGHQQITPLHVLKGLLDDEDRLAANLIEASDGRAAVVGQDVERELAKLPKVEGSGAGQVYLAPETARLFDQAEQLSQKAGDSFVTVEYMLLALALAGGTAWLANTGYGPVYGARPLKRVIQRQLQNPLAKMLLSGAMVDGEAVRGTVADGQLAINGSKLAQAA